MQHEYIHTPKNILPMQVVYTFLKTEVEELAWELALHWSVLGSHKCNSYGSFF